MMPRPRPPGLIADLSRPGMPALGLVALVPLALAVLSTTALPHELQVDVTSGQAVVIRLHYPDGTAFSFESYEIYRDDAEIPVQVGRTDHAGLIAFVPPGAGTWRLTTFSEDGHGKEMTFTTDAAGMLLGSSRPLFERFPRLLTGIGLILGIFGLLVLLLRRK